MAQGISFLHRFDLGNRQVQTPGSNILYVSSTAAGDFGKANLTTESLRQGWRSSGVDTWQEIIIEAEQASSINTFAILGHNLTPTAVVQIQANISNNFFAPPITLTTPWSDNNIVEIRPFGGSYKYYKVRILDPANPSGYIQVGRIVGGRAFTLGYAEDITDDFEIGYTDMADTSRTEGFFRVSNEKIKVRSLSAKFQKLQTIAPENSNYLGLRDLFNHVGVTRPFLVIADRTDPSFCSIWGQFDKLPSDAFSISRRVSFSFNLTEVF